MHVYVYCETFYCSVHVLTMPPAPPTHTHTHTHTHIQPNSLPKPDEAITSLVQFSTFINSSVVVAGTRGGTLTWYIAQPPQKTFSVLYTDKNQHAQHSVVALQVSLRCYVLL